MTVREVKNRLWSQILFIFSFIISFWGLENSKIVNSQIEIEKSENSKNYKLLISKIENEKNRRFQNSTIQD